MSRGIPQGLLDAVTSRSYEPFFAVEIELDTTPVYLWSGIGDLVVGGKTYRGVGEFLQISDIQEGIDLAAKGANVGLSGVPSDMLAMADGEDYQGRVGKVLFGVVNEAALVEDLLLYENEDSFIFEDGDTMDTSYDASTFLFELFSGKLDQMNIDEGPETSVISASIESKFIDLRKPRIRRYTDADQQSRYPGDLAFEFVNKLQSQNVPWGN